MFNKTAALFWAAQGLLTMAGEHRVTQIIPLAGDGGSDALCLDSEARRLYVARGNSVVVMDVDSGRFLTTINDLPGIGGIAVAPAVDRGYVTATADNKVSIFNLGRFEHLGGIAVGKEPVGIVFDATASRFYTLDRESKTASAIDPDDGEVEVTIDLQGRPAGAASDNKGRVFITLDDTGELAWIDAAVMKLEKKWPLNGCPSPRAIAMDAARDRLLISCDKGRIAVVDAGTGRVVSTTETGAQAGGGDIAVDSGSGTAFVANRQGSVTVLSETGDGKYKVTGEVHTASGARVMAFDPKTRQLFVLSPDAPDQGARPVDASAKREAAGTPQSTRLLVIHD